MPSLPSLTTILSAVFVIYIASSLWQFYGVFNPKPCPKTASCLKPFLDTKAKFQLTLFTAKSGNVKSSSEFVYLWRSGADFDPSLEMKKEINISLPLSTRRNGTLYIHVFLHLSGDEHPWTSQFVGYQKRKLAKHAFKKADAFNLMKSKDSESKPDKDYSGLDRIAHWKSDIFINVMTDKISLDRQSVMPVLIPYIRLNDIQEYFPMTYADALSERERHLIPIDSNNRTMPLTINYSPTSLGRLQLWLNIENSMIMMKQLGFSDKDLDEVKGIFTDTNTMLLMLGMFVSAFHLLFDILAFKNDVSFWRKRKTMVGVSSKNLFFRFISYMIIFLYLNDEGTSLLVLGPCGVSVLIEFWKVTKALKVKIKFTGFKPSISFGTESDQEKLTSQIDSLALKYLSVIMIPLCIGGAIYSLMYTPFKSWYSWCIHSLVNGVYCFGFLFMLPQLFLNYKLKSVAALPWRSFMYKAFNTFIDDIFAFIITMPTSHRIACFRDDIVFVIYLYQRWLYPVDKSRINEYGQVVGEDEELKKQKTD